MGRNNEFNMGRKEICSTCVPFIANSKFLSAHHLLFNQTSCLAIAAENRNLEGKPMTYINGGAHVLKMGRVWSLALPQIRKGNVSITGVHYSKYCSLLLPMSDPFALGSGSFPSGIRDELIGYCWPKTTKLRSSSIKQQSQCPKRKKKLTD